MSVGFGQPSSKSRTVRLFGREVDYKVRKIGDGFARPGKQQSSLQASSYMTYADSWYFRVLDSSYPTVYRNVIMAYVTVSILFTLITLPIAGTIGISVDDIESMKNANPNFSLSFSEKFSRALVFSVTHVVSMGYGQFYAYDWTRNEPHLGLFFLASFQQFTGLVINVLVFTILVTKIQHPTAAIVFAKRALVTTRNGQRVLLFRIGNLRCNHIYMPSVRLSVLKQELTREGENYMKWVPLQVTEIPVVTAVAVVEHKITEKSPLNTEIFPDGFCQEYLEDLANNHDLAISLTFMGTDGVYHDEISAAHRYFRDDIVFGRMRFADVMETVELGRPFVPSANVPILSQIPVIGSVITTGAGVLLTLGALAFPGHNQNIPPPKKRVIANFEKIGSMQEFDNDDEASEYYDDYGTSHAQPAALVDTNKVAPIMAENVSSPSDAGRVSTNAWGPWQKPPVIDPGFAVSRIVSNDTTMASATSSLTVPVSFPVFNCFGNTGESKDAPGTHQTLAAYNASLANPMWCVRDVGGTNWNGGHVSSNVDLYPSPCDWNMLQGYRELKLAKNSSAESHPYVVRNTPFGMALPMRDGEVGPETYCVGEYEHSCNYPECLRNPQPNVVYLFCGGNSRQPKEEDRDLGVATSSILGKGLLVKVCSVSGIVECVLKAAKIPHQMIVVDIENKPKWWTHTCPAGTTPSILYNGTYMSESADIIELLCRDFGESHMKRYLQLPLTEKSSLHQLQNPSGDIESQKSHHEPHDTAGTEERSAEQAADDGPKEDKELTFTEKFAELHRLKPMGLPLTKSIFGCTLGVLFMIVRAQQVLTEMPAAQEEEKQFQQQNPNQEVPKEIADKREKLRKFREDELPEKFKFTMTLFKEMDDQYKSKKGAQWLYGDRISLDDCVLLALMTILRNAIIAFYPMRDCGWPPVFSTDESELHGQDLYVAGMTAAGAVRKMLPPRRHKAFCLSLLDFPHLEKAINDFRATELGRIMQPAPRPPCFYVEVMKKKFAKMFGLNVPDDPDFQKPLWQGYQYMYFIQNKLVLPAFFFANRWLMEELKTIDTLRSQKSSDVISPKSGPSEIDLDTDKENPGSMARAIRDVAILPMSGSDGYPKAATTVCQSGIPPRLWPSSAVKSPHFWTDLMKLDPGAYCLIHREVLSCCIKLNDAFEGYCNTVASGVFDEKSFWQFVMGVDFQEFPMSADQPRLSGNISGAEAQHAVSVLPQKQPQTAPQNQVQPQEKDCHLSPLHKSGIQGSSGFPSQMPPGHYQLPVQQPFGIAEMLHTNQHYHHPHAISHLADRSSPMMSKQKGISVSQQAGSPELFTPNSMQQPSPTSMAPNSVTRQLYSGPMVSNSMQQLHPDPMVPDSVSQPQASLQRNSGSSQSSQNQNPRVPSKDIPSRRSSKQTIQRKNSIASASLCL